jgi:DNA-binding NtrC family response regulator
MIDLACVMSDGKEIQAEDINYTSVRTDEIFTAIEKTLKEYNIDIINFFMNKYNNNVIGVSHKLGISKSTIYNLIKAGEINLN